MESFRVGQMTDSHIYGGVGALSEAGLRRRDAFYRACLREVAAHDVDLIVHTGDLVNGDRGEPYHRRFRALIDEMSGELSRPIRICRGNHEGPPNIPDPLYREIWGPSNWLHKHKGWAFLGVDRYYRTYSHGGAQFAMSPECFAEVDALLADIPDAMPTVVMLHDNPVGISDFWHGEEFLYRIKQKNVALLLFGHVQGNWVSTFKGIPHYTVVGERQCFDSSPLTYNILTCNGDGSHVCDFFPYRIHTPQAPALRAEAGKATVKADADWRDLRGPGGARATEAELPGKAPGLAWSAKLPGGLSVGAPALKDGVLYVSTKTHGRFEQCAAVALDAATGGERWQTRLDGSGEGGVCLHGGSGYVGTTAGSIFRLRLEDGAVAWRWNNGENIPLTCPLTADAEEGVIHAGANFEMYAVNAEEGATLWRTTTTLRGCGYFTGGHAAPAVGKDRVFHRRPYGAWDDENRFMHSVDKRTGLDPLGAPPRYTDQAMMRHASPILHRGFLIAVGHGLWVSEEEQDVRAPYLWQEHAQGGATPAAAESRIYVSYHSEIVAYDLFNGLEAVWRVPHEPALLHFGGGEGSKLCSNYGEYPTNGTFSAPLVCGDKLLVCDTAGLCRCLRCADGREVWRLRVGAPILCAPVVSGNALFFGDYRGDLYAFAW